MSIKQILVPLTGETRAEHVCDMAFAIGAKCKAHVIGTDTVSEPGPFLDQSGVGMMAGYYDDLFKAADKVQQHKRLNAAQAFDAARTRAGASQVRKPQKSDTVSANWISGVEYDGATVPLFGRLSDLIVVNQPGPNSSYGEMEVFEKAVFTARRPVLMVPVAARALGRRAAIAWNGSVEACGAVEGAIDLLMGLDGVDVIQVGEIKAGNASADSLADYLGWHGINAAVRALPDAGDDVAKAVIEEAKRCGATFLVMGAYGHSPLREFILGGVTKQMIEIADLPVLMAH